MYRLVLINVLLVLVTAQPKDDCGRLMRGVMKCCNKEVLKTPFSDDIKECFKLKDTPGSCEIGMCVAKKKGIASEDGTIDKKALTESIEQEFESEPNIVESIKNKCIKGDLSIYGKPEFCEMLKLTICIDLQIAKDCEEWKNNGECNGMKEIAEECVRKYS